RSRKPRVAAGALAARQQAARGSRHAAEGDVPRKAERRMSDQLQTAAPTSDRMVEDLLRPLENTSWRFYRIVLFLGSIVAMGGAAFAWQVWYGLGEAGLRWPIFWAFYITNFVFWIGISHAGTLISAILRLVNAGWRRPVTRCAEVITAFALM